MLSAHGLCVNNVNTEGEGGVSDMLTNVNKGGGGVMTMLTLARGIEV